MSTLIDLRARAIAVAEAATALTGRRRAEVGEARRELHLASTWHLRRAGVPESADNRVYRHGSNEQALGALDLCPIATLGFKAAGVTAYPWLIEAAQANPAGTYLDHLRAALVDPDCFAYCTALGAYHRFQWKWSVYQQVVADWRAKPIARDLHAAWRRRPTTAKQRYLIEIVSECLTAVEPGFTVPALDRRGEAHDWLYQAGGRPVFWRAPALPTFGGMIVHE